MFFAGNSHWNGFQRYLVKVRIHAVKVKININHKSLIYASNRQIGFYGVFSISATLYLFAFLYGLICVPEPAVLKKQKELNDLKSSNKSMLADFFDRKHVVETFEVAFKRGANQRRLRVIMLMIVVMVVIGPMHGEMSVVYLFTRYQFNWSEVEFSFFSTYGMLTGLVGKLIDFR